MPPWPPAFGSARWMFSAIINYHEDDFAFVNARIIVPGMHTLGVLVLARRRHGYAPLASDGDGGSSPFHPAIFRPEKRADQRE